MAVTGPRGSNDQPGRQSNIAWSWRDALFGTALAAIPMIVIAVGHVTNGLPFLIGALPAAIIGLLPRRKARTQLIVVGVLFGASMMLGSLVASSWWLAVPAMFVAGLGAAMLAARRSLGTLAMNLCVPLIGIGLSYAGLKNSAGIALLIMLGSLVGFCWSWTFPEFAAAERRPAILMSPAVARDYGIRLGLTGATAAGIGYALGADHIGWIAGASLLVMRPVADMQELRSVGRVISVFAGALVASWLLGLHLNAVAIASLTGAALIAAAATHSSRWYVTPAFTTFLVFWALLYGEASKASITHRFDQRVLETILGVSVAYFFGLLIPRVRAKRVGN